MSMNENKPLISIIIPAYNIENYIDKCLESVCGQTLKNIEIILVNDGSTDSTPSICERWAAKDPRIKYVTTENSGLASVCNTGLEIASAPIIGFADSDDHIDKDMFECLYNSMIKYGSDISICGLYWELADGTIKCVKGNFKREMVWCGKQALKLLLMDRKISNYRWNKLFRKELFDNILFPADRAFEDINTMFQLFDKAKKVSHIGYPKYYYHQRKGSIMNCVNLCKEKDYFIAKLDQLKFLDNHPDFTKIEKELIRVFFLKNMVDNHRFINKKMPESTEKQEVMTFMENALREHYCKSYTIGNSILHKYILSLRKKPMKWFY